MLHSVRARMLLAVFVVIAGMPQLMLAPNASAATINFVTVGDPGNAADPSNGFGSIGTIYEIGQTEVSNTQYIDFLNSVASTDTYGLYNTSMAFGAGGIARSGSAGSYAYSAVSGRGNMPVNFVSFYDALRFSNWLHNGQPTGAQDSTTTEDGAYTITVAGIAANSIMRNLGATVFLPTEDEWYKAAYYHALSTSYFDYAAGSSALPTCAAPSGAANNANCDMVAGDLTQVGSYTGSLSPYGTFDQGGNVREWNETIRFGSHRGVGGGGFETIPTMLASSNMSAFLPSIEKFDQGFRVARLPEPRTGLLLLAGLIAAALVSRRRP